MWPLDVLHDPAWQPLTLTLLHFLWQGMIVAAVWMVLFRLSRARATQFRYLLGLFGMFLLAACPVATFVFLESTSCSDEARLSIAPAVVHGSPDVPKVTPLPAANVAQLRDLPAVGSASSWSRDPVHWIGTAQPYLLGGWIVGLVFLSGRLLFGVVGAHRLGRGRLALSGEIADRAAALAARLGLRSAPRIFSAKAAREAVVIGLLRPIVLLPVAWLAEMTPEVLEAVIAHELAHIRRFDVWFNLFQRFVETLLFYHPAVWWLSRRVRLAREMCCDELAARATGERVVYATALELAARKRLEPAKKSLLEVALGITRMTLLDRVRNVLGLAARHEQGRWWPAAVMTLLVLPAVWFASMAATSAQEDKPVADAKPIDKKVDLARDSDKPAAMADTRAKNTATAFFRIAMEENPLMGGTAVQVDRDRFEIFKNTQAEMLKSRVVLRAALKSPKVAKWIRRQKVSGDLANLIANGLQVSFPNRSEIMKVSLHTVDSVDAVMFLNAIVNAYMAEIVNAEQDRKHRRFEELEKICGEKEQQIRSKREQLKQLVASAGGGSSSPETRNTRQKIILDELALYRAELAKSTFELGRYKVDLAVQKAFLEDAKGDARAPILKEIKRLEVSLKVMDEQRRELATKTAKVLEEATHFGQESVDIEMVQAELRNMDQVLTNFIAEKERMSVEMRTAPRVTLLERAE